MVISFSRLRTWSGADKDMGGGRQRDCQAQVLEAGKDGAGAHDACLTPDVRPRLQLQIHMSATMTVLTQMGTVTGPV